MQPFRRWMLCISGMLLGMILIGGITRLTGSGLSMVTWEPISGMLPPLTQSAWDVLFGQYQATPEFQKVNSFFTLTQFKTIFWWEYLHRFWGRLMGLILLIPTYIAFRTPLPLPYRWGVVGLWLGGGCQAFLGWWMVKSGLKDMPWVSHYRLSMHLIMGLVLFSLSLQLTFENPILSRKAGLLWSRYYARVVLVLLMLTIAWGGLVAGQHAGLIHNTFPLMGGQWMPEDGFHLSPVWWNAFENPALVQWIHRMLASITFTAVTTLALKGYCATKHRYFVWLMAMCGAQVVLGIGTLLFQVPTILAVSHQLGAFLLWGMVWRLAHFSIFKQEEALNQRLAYV